MPSGLLGGGLVQRGGPTIALLYERSHHIVFHPQPPFLPAVMLSAADGFVVPLACLLYSYVKTVQTPNDFFTPNLLHSNNITPS